MSEALFPILGPLVVFLVALPLCALVAKGLLVGLSVRDRDAVHANHGLRYAILVSATVVPLVWFVSAAIVQAGSAARVCATGHSPGASCWEAVYFALALGTICTVVGLRRARRRVLSSRSDVALEVARRIERLRTSHPALASLGSRLVVADKAREPICTMGIFSPRVVVQTRFAAGLDDSALAGALLHELEHVHARDPLRYFIASWSLALNPLGALLLRGEHARWVLGREAHCDREAVLSGAKPAALAHALVAAARVPHSTPVPCLGGGRLAAVRFRVGLLLAYADRAPTRCCHDGPALRPAILVALLMFALPYVAGTDVLDAVHAVAELGLHFPPS